MRDILLFIILFIVSTFIIYIICDDELSSFPWGIFLSLILFGIIGGLFSAKLIDTEEYVVSQTDLYAIKDSNGIEGTKFLFSGYIEDKLTIRYVLNTENGKQVKEKTITDDIFIKEENTDSPRMVVYGDRITNNTWYKKLICCNWFREDTEKRIIFIVPEDTVINEYDINLE